MCQLQSNAQPAHLPAPSQRRGAGGGRRPRELRSFAALGGETGRRQAKGAREASHREPQVL